MRTEKKLKLRQLRRHVGVRLGIQRVLILDLSHEQLKKIILVERAFGIRRSIRRRIGGGARGARGARVASGAFVGY